MLRILLIEDERINRVTLQQLLEHSGYSVRAEEDGLAGIEALNSGDFDVVISDLRLPGADGVEILKHAKSINPQIHFLIMTAFATVENAVEALKNGAYDYLTKPFDPEELFHHLRSIKQIIGLNQENVALKASLAEIGVLPDLIGQSKNMLELFQKMRMVADSDHTILLQGASGTGKEMIAKSIQGMGSRKNAPYVKVNCSALSESLFEAEMFGHEKGAFTGAVKRTLGRFERAEGGTIFLDDIDDLSLALQTKLLRVIQEGEIERVGGDRVINVDVRLIAATKIDLKERVESGHFREDLYYRLNVIKLEIPELNQRRDDIPLLARHFLNRTNPELDMSPELLKYLQDLDWPGNVRELEHLILQMSIFAKDKTLALDDLPDVYQPVVLTHSSNHIEALSLTEKLNCFEAELIQNAMRDFNGNQLQVAKALGIPRTTLRSKLHKFGMLDLED